MTNLAVEGRFSETNDKHQKRVDELIKNDCHITQKQIAGRLGISKERVGYIIVLLGYTKVFLMGTMHVDARKQKCVECCEEHLKCYRRGKSISFECCYWR